MIYHTFFLLKIRKMLQNLSSAAIKGYHRTFYYLFKDALYSIKLLAGHNNCGYQIKHLHEDISILVVLPVETFAPIKPIQP